MRKINVKSHIVQNKKEDHDEESSSSDTNLKSQWKE